MRRRAANGQNAAGGQLSLWDRPAAAKAVVEPNRTVPAAAVPRVSRQCSLILDRLRRGRATNAELAGIALKYTGRLSDTRAAGYDVRCVSHDHATGVAVYALFEDDAEVSGRTGEAVSRG
jgi:hypothetical protein